jgi:hypothetical protein
MTLGFSPEDIPWFHRIVGKTRPYKSKYTQPTLPYMTLILWDGRPARLSHFRYNLYLTNRTII